MRNLGTLPGPNSTSDERMSRALAINEHGQIVGESTVLESDAWHSRPVVWQGGRIRSLPLLEGDRDGGATAVNEFGDIVGWSAPDTNRIGASLHAVLWRDGRVHDLGVMTDYGGASINDGRQVVTSSGRLLSADRSTNLCARVLSPCTAYAINNRGQVVGSQAPEDNWLFGTGVLWTAGRALSFRSIGLSDINERGEIAGADQEGHGVPDRAYVWKPKRSR